jgi:hypothetical protein
MKNKPTQAPSRTRRACIACKLIKSKCEAPNDLSAACRRCARLGIPCEFSEKPRGVRDDGSFGVKRHAPRPTSLEACCPRISTVMGHTVYRGFGGSDDRSDWLAIPPDHQRRALNAMPLPVPFDELQMMHSTARARGDSAEMAYVALLAGASGA